MPICWCILPCFFLSTNIREIETNNEFTPENRLKFPKEMIVFLYRRFQVQWLLVSRKGTLLYSNIALVGKPPCKFVFPIGKGRLSSQLCQLREITGGHKSFCRGKFKEGTPELWWITMDFYNVTFLHQSQWLQHAAEVLQLLVTDYTLIWWQVSGVGIFGVICCSTAIKSFINFIDLLL